MDLHFGGRVAASETRRKRRERLQCFERTVVGVVTHRSDGRVEFVIDVREMAVRMKRDMPWSRAAFQTCRRRFVLRQLSGVGIELEDQDLVESQVADEGEMIRGIELNAM